MNSGRVLLYLLCGAGLIMAIVLFVAWYLSVQLPKY